MRAIAAALNPIEPTKGQILVGSSTEVHHLVPLENSLAMREAAIGYRFCGEDGGGASWPPTGGTARRRPRAAREPVEAPDGRWEPGQSSRDTFLGGALCIAAGFGYNVGQYAREGRRV